MIYSVLPKILVKTRDKIIVKFGRTIVPIYKDDEIFVLTDVFYDEAEQGNEPNIKKMDFDEFYMNIDGDDDGWCFEDKLSYICGLSVKHH